MKCKFSIQERKNLKGIIENPRLSGGVSLKQIKSSLELIDKLEYKGKKEDPDILTEIDLKDSDVQHIYRVANDFTGWPVAQWVADMHERLEKYHSKMNDNQAA